MAAPKNLYEYYTARGKQLPSISERSQIFQNLGLGSSSSYTGAEQQNKQLLAALDLQSARAGATPASPATPTKAPATAGQMPNLPYGTSGASMLNPPTQPTKPATSSTTTSTEQNAFGVVGGVNVQTPDYAANQTALDALSSMSGVGLDTKTIQDKLMSEAGTVSSQTNDVDKYINDAIASQRSAAENNQKYIESKFGRESSYLLDNLTNERTALLEAGRGNALGGSGLNIVDKEIEKSLRDLDQRKNELILQGNMAAADKISELQVKGLEYRQKAQQSVFDRMLQAGTYGQNAYKIYESIAGNASKMQSDELDYTINRNKLQLAKASTLADAILKTSEIKIQEDYYKSNKNKDAVDKVQPDAGYSSFEVQTAFNSQVSQAILKAANELKAGGTEQAAYASIMNTYASLRKQMPEAAVSQEAFDEAFGIQPDGSIKFGSFNLGVTGAFQEEDTGFKTGYVAPIWGLTTQYALEWMSENTEFLNNLVTDAEGYIVGILGDNGDITPVEKKN